MEQPNDAPLPPQDATEAGGTGTATASAPAPGEFPAASSSSPVSTQRHGSITVATGERVTRIELTGDIDVLMKDELFDNLEQAARAGLPVEVDCSQVRFIDSTGLSALAWLASLEPEPPRLIGVPGTMRELLTLTGMRAAFSLTSRDDVAP